MAETNTALEEEDQSNQNQYLTFFLADEEYGVDILRVQEIRGWEQPTAIPNTPEYILGVINIRGTVVPIVDLRRRFSLDDIEVTKKTVMVVVKVKHDDGERTIGMVVDAVSDVYNVREKDIRPAPDFGGAVSTDFIKGLASVNDSMIILLDIDTMINVGLLSKIERD